MSKHKKADDAGAFSSTFCSRILSVRLPAVNDAADQITAHIHFSFAAA
ncbi:hypothetical protein [Paenibacillus shenyangensis]|nr:hypothetical protein [Paenibacillus sp. A9]